MPRGIYERKKRGPTKRRYRVSHPDMLPPDAPDKADRKRAQAKEMSYGEREIKKLAENILNQDRDLERYRRVIDSLLFERDLLRGRKV